MEAWMAHLQAAGFGFVSRCSLTLDAADCAIRVDEVGTDSNNGLKIGS
jgi:hypothetical protein